MVPVLRDREHFLSILLRARGDIARAVLVQAGGEHLPLAHLAEHELGLDVVQRAWDAAEVHFAVNLHRLRRGRGRPRDGFKRARPGRRLDTERGVHAGVQFPDFLDEGGHLARVHVEGLLRF